MIASADNPTLDGCRDAACAGGSFGGSIAELRREMLRDTEAFLTRHLGRTGDLAWYVPPVADVCDEVSPC